MWEFEKIKRNALEKVYGKELSNIYILVWLLLYPCFCLGCPHSVIIAQIFNEVTPIFYVETNK